MFRRLLTGLAIMVGVAVLAIQFIPYGRSHTNPPVQQEPTWASAQGRQLAVQACFDCHSNQTRWAWYTSVAPVSWLAQRDVDQGRAKLNFSEWQRPQEEADEAAETVQKGEMPPWFYVALHPDARLTAAQQQALIQELTATLGQGEGDSGEDDDDE